MGKKVERVQRRTLAVGCAEAVTREDGFTLLEVVCVVAIISIMAAIIVPSIPRGTSRARVEAYALETASVLKADRNAAVRRRIEVATQIDANSRSIRSGATGRVVQVPDDVLFDATLAARCEGRTAGNTISFFATG